MTEIDRKSFNYHAVDIKQIIKIKEIKINTNVNIPLFIGDIISDVQLQDYEDYTDSLPDKATYVTTHFFGIQLSEVFNRQFISEFVDYLCKHEQALYICSCSGGNFYGMPQIELIQKTS